MRLAQQRMQESKGAQKGDADRAVGIYQVEVPRLPGDNAQSPTKTLKGETPDELQKKVALHYKQLDKARQAKLEEARQEVIARVEGQFIEEIAALKAHYGDETEPTFAQISPEDKATRMASKGLQHRSGRPLRVPAYPLTPS